MEKKIKKIVILGAESTGKSTLCKQLAIHYNTFFVPEFARTYFEEHDINNYNISDLEIIAKKQLDLERDLIKKANTYLFCDTSLITLKIWSTHAFNIVPDFITKNIKSRDYDMYIILNNEVKWVLDSQRKNEDLREHLFKSNKDELEKLNIDYKIIKGEGEVRLKNAIRFIDENFNL